MGPIFHKKSATTGLISKIFQGSQVLKIWCVFVAKLQEIGTFFEKSLNMGIYFGKITPEYGYRSWTAGSTSPTNPKLSTPPGVGWQFGKVNHLKSMQMQWGMNNTDHKFVYIAKETKEKALSQHLLI